MVTSKKNKQLTVPEVYSSTGLMERLRFKFTANIKRQIQVENFSE